MGMLKGFAGMEPAGHETDAVLIAIGVLIIVVAAFGCFGAWKESPKLLYIVSSTLYTLYPLYLPETSHIMFAEGQSTLKNPYKNKTYVRIIK